MPPASLPTLASSAAPNKDVNISFVVFNWNPGANFPLTLFWIFFPSAPFNLSSTPRNLRPPLTISSNRVATLVLNNVGNPFNFSNAFTSHPRNPSAAAATAAIPAVKNPSLVKSLGMIDAKAAKPKPPPKAFIQFGIPPPPGFLSSGLAEPP